jgi:hypothetical protein
MKWIDVISNNPIQGRRTIARCILDEDGNVEIEGDMATVRELKRGYRGLKNGQAALIRPNDGLDFLEAVSRQCNNHMIVASQIQEGDKPPKLEINNAPPSFDQF